MKPSFLLLHASGPALFAALFLAACAGTTTSSVDPDVDAAGGTSPVTGESDAGVGDASKKDARGPEPKAGPVAVMNLSYVNDPATLSTKITFVLKNAADQPIEKIRSVKLLFDGTEVVTWGELGEYCTTWTVFPRSTSPVLTMSVGTYDTDDANPTAAVTCSDSSQDVRGRRPRATRLAIGQGTVTVVVNGVMSDATAFVAQAEAPAP